MQMYTYVPQFLIGMSIVSICVGSSMHLGLVVLCKNQCFYLLNVCYWIQIRKTVSLNILKIIKKSPIKKYIVMQEPSYVGKIALLSI